MSDTIVTAHGDGWLQVRIPLPYALKWVNAYLIPGSEGYTLVDPGLHTQEAVAAWSQALKESGIGLDRIVRIIVTHHHPDHYGLAGWFEERTGAPVWMSRIAREAALRLWSEGETYSALLTEAFRAHGLPDDLAAGMLAHLTDFRERVSPQPREVEWLEPGGTIRFADRTWELIGGEGHAPGHVALFDRAGGRLLCGDQILPDISPNIGWMPGGDPNPLRSYLDSLAPLRELGAGVVAYPGHRGPFAGAGERADELARHHARRLERILELIGDGKPSAFEICESLFGVRLRGNLHNLRFALAETLAHLILLESRGQLRREGEDAVRFART